MLETREVLVHKANLSLNENESIGDFMKEMRLALKADLLTKLKIAQTGWLWPVEVYSKSVIAEVSTDSKKDNEPRYRLYRIDYTRKNGVFSFGKHREVKRGYIDVETGIEVSKSVEVEKRAELWQGVV